MRRLRLVASLLVIAVGACSSGDAPKTQTATRPSALRSKLLTTSQLPAGFKRISIEERDPTTTSDEYCAEIDTHRKNFPGERVAEAQFQRVVGTTTVYVNEQITRYAATGDATRAFADFEKALDSCGQVTKKNGENELSGTFQPVEFVEVGDDSYATTFSATQMYQGDTASISGYFVTLRTRRYVTLFSMLSTVDTVDKTQVESIVKKLVTRI